MRYFEEFKYRDFGKFGPGYWERFEEESKDFFANKQNNTDVGMSLQRYRNPVQKDEEPFIAPLFFDIDDHSGGRIALEEAREVIWFLLQEFELSNEYFRVWFSGRKGFHLSIEEGVLGITPHPKLNEVHRKIGNHVKQVLGLTCLDHHSFDRRRLARIPNTIHSETGLFKVELYVSELLHKNIDEIKRLAQKPRQLFHSEELELNTPSAEKYMEIWREVIGEETQYLISPTQIEFPCVKKIFMQGPSRLGTRHDSTMILAVHFKNNLKLSELETLNVLLEWNEKYFKMKMSSEKNFSAVERNVRSQVRGVYTRGYRIGCRESTYAPLLREHCNRADCPFYKSNRGTVPIIREVRYSYLWNKQDGMGSSCQRVYETMVDWSNRNQKSDNPMYEGKKTFYISASKLGELSQLSKNVAKLKLEVLVVTGLIKRVPQIELPPKYKRNPGRRTCDYYIIPDWSRENEKTAWERWRRVKENIKSKPSISKIREAFNSEKTTKRYLRDTIEKLIQRKGEFSISDLKRERVSVNVIRRYLNELVAKRKDICIEYNSKGKRVYRYVSGSSR